MLHLVHSPVAVGTGDTVAHISKTLHDIEPAAWNLCFPAQVEDYDCLLAIEEAGLVGFEWRYVTLIENEVVVAAMPFFICPYALDTTLEEGSVRRIVRRMRQWSPRLLTMRLACLGSPCTENATIGFHPDVAGSQRPALFSQLLSAFEAYATDEKCTLMGVKDVPETTPFALVDVLRERGFATIGSLPTASLDIDFTTIEDYLECLSASTRKDMRRKLKSLEKVRIETRTDFADLLPQVMALYHDTRNRSEWQFEELTEAYFSGILARMEGRAFCTFYFVGDTLIAANLLVHDDETLIDKFFCMDGEKGRAYNPYFLSWFTNLRYCLDHDLTRYQSGQAYYENKIRLGSALTANSMFFRHRNPIMHALLKLLSPIFSTDEVT
ncbi:GNAT family N-acetyltransferase [Agrobacterium vaccinii]|uniref:GNAT family N-acetyltransferase n=1 Tax=Agrobacterium vaccinii TaxID=2735528 RepID=UPI001E4F0319|nr:GNAT family N-acetyltransferase [Agrobacterium vaccinii]UHS58678.1 GNAT family N-acetyltransferase [Agrobacterium vaccinii]